jgi:hypothetical protein
MIVKNVVQVQPDVDFHKIIVRNKVLTNDNSGSISQLQKQVSKD